MANLFAFLLLVCVVLLVIGFFSPTTSLFWYKQERTKKTSAKIYGISLIVLFILIGITAPKAKTGPSSSGADTASTVETEAEVETSNDVVVGQTLHTPYFDIIVKKVSLQDRVNTGNQFVDLKPEPGIMYLIIDATFKNTDNESRMILDGSVWINYNGKDYEYDKSETILLEGWGLLLDQINPLTTKTTNLVYKIPAEIKGKAFWQPGRSESDQKIYLGTL